MASEVKGAHRGILKIPSSFSSFPSEAVDLRHLVCTAFFHYGVAARRLHQTAKRGRSRTTLRLDRPTASPSACASENPALLTSALQSGGLTLLGGRLVRGQLDARAASRQGRKAPLRSAKAEPHRGPIQAARSGTVAHGCSAGSRSPTCRFLQHPWWC